MLAEPPAVCQRPDAMLEEGARLRGASGRPVAIVLVGRQRWRFEKRHDFVEDGTVAGRLDVMSDGEGKPEEVVAEARADTIAGRLVPPVLDVAFEELAAGGAQEMPTGLLGCRVHERHHVLQLVAGAVGAARLIEARPSPEPTGEHLIDEPAIDEHIEGWIRRLDANRP